MTAGARPAEAARRRAGVQAAQLVRSALPGQPPLPRGGALNRERLLWTDTSQKRVVSNETHGGDDLAAAPDANRCEFRSNALPSETQAGPCRILAEVPAARTVHELAPSQRQSRRE